MACTLAVAAAAHAAPCHWDRPGVAPFDGDVVAAVDRYTDIPADVRARLKARMARHDHDELVRITRDSIEGVHAYEPVIRDMHFAGGRVCREVSRTGWPAGAVERGLVYCDSGHCIVVPTVCRNVARITRRPPVDTPIDITPSAGLPPGVPPVLPPEVPGAALPPADTAAGGLLPPAPRVAGAPPIGRGVPPLLVLPPLLDAPAEAPPPAVATGQPPLLVLPPLLDAPVEAPPPAVATGRPPLLPAVPVTGVPAPPGALLPAFPLPEVIVGGGNPAPPVPEPSTWALLAIGVAAVALTRRRPRRRACRRRPAGRTSRGFIPPPSTP